MPSCVKDQLLSKKRQKQQQLPRPQPLLHMHLLQQANERSACAMNENDEVLQPKFRYLTA